MMRKWLSIISGLILVLIILGMGRKTNTLEIKVDFPIPKISKVGKYHRIIMQDIGNMAKPGEPLLPEKTVKILIPYGKEIGEIDVMGKRKVTLEGEYHIEPGERPVPLSYKDASTFGGEPCFSASLRNKGKIRPTPRDERIYNSEKPFPGRWYTFGSVQSMRGYRILIVNLHPVEYIPKEGRISYYKRMLIRVKTRPIEKPIPFRGRIEDERRVKELVVNPEEILSYPEGGK